MSLNRDTAIKTARIIDDQERKVLGPPDWPPARSLTGLHD
jgi:hypothetical protein